MFSIFKYDSKRPGSSVFRFGSLIVVPIIIFIIIWMAYAPLSSASIASGQIALSADRSVIQHLEGGIVEKLFVSEGQVVNKNDPILLIRSLPQDSRKMMLMDRIAATKALILRLQAQISGLKKIDFSAISDTGNISNELLQKHIYQQQKIFSSYLNLSASEDELIITSLNKINIEIDSINTRLKARKKQLDIEKELLLIKTTLEQQGLIPKTEILEIEKTIAILEGEIDADLATIASLENNAIVIKVEKAKQDEQKRIDFLRELEQSQTSLKTLEQELITLEDQILRTLIKAPISGKILDLQIFASGEVIAPGSRIMDIIPLEQKLIVEAKVSPQDIDLVAPGSKAKVQITPYNVKKLPRIDGVVSTISADILTDQLTGMRYYLARINIDFSQIKATNGDIVITPGMPVEVFLFAKDRTMLDYLISPITDVAYKSFREE